MASFVRSKKLSQRKKPKTNSTWSSSTMTLTLHSDVESIQQVEPFDLISTQERIRAYEQKYQNCMVSNTALLTWIKSVHDKGLPTPLVEGSYIPPPSSKSTTTRSRLPDVFSSLSSRTNTTATTANKHRSSVEPIITKSSLSTFLKKATDSLSLPKRQQKSTQQQQQQRFSLTSSLNRFSLPKNSSYMNMAEKYHSMNSGSANNTSSKQRNRFSSPPPLPNPHHYQYQNQRKQQYNISPPELITSSNIMTTNLADLQPNKKTSSARRRPQSTILPHSPSSIFLDRLRSRNTNNTGCDLIEEKELMIQQYSNKQDVYYPHIYTIVDNYIEDITPPSSPSSTDSTATPPSLITTTTFTTHSEQHQKENLTPIKKKRTSLLISPSLSTIRLISQKSQFLKRSSMMSS